LDPIHEVVQRRLIELSILAEQHTAALRRYEACVRILNEELGVTPEEETVDLYEAMKQRHIMTPTGGQETLPANLSSPFTLLDRHVPQRS
jgi:DNA-binding SARP family transcriptional activator